MAVHDRTTRLRGAPQGRHTRARGMPLVFGASFVDCWEVELVVLARFATQEAAMSTATGEVCSFGQDHFGTAQLGDARRTARLVYTADRIVQHPGGTLPDKLADPADLTALYRLANAPPVTHAAVLQPHRERTQQRAAAY